MDGCKAATYIAYAFSEVGTIYPITPIAEMGQVADKWSVQGIKNLLGSPMQVKEMESELGAAGATHGALAGGALATTFTNSQGLMLMIPNMFKIAGEKLPGVFHVGCRSVATHALSIFGDHSDVMATRATGFTYLCSNSVQETHDLAIVAHIAALEGSLPVCHFFDGWRTSNETATIEVTPYSDLAPLMPLDKVEAFRKRAMNPEHPQMRGSAQNWDTFFQNAEAGNGLYDAFPGIVQKAMDSVAHVTGRQYHLFDYVGHPQADRVIVAMGSACEVIEDTIDYLSTRGYRVGLVKVRLWRPFDPAALLAAIPANCKMLAVLDRTKEPGALGEPLYMDICTALQQAGRNIRVIGGRYGLSSKEFDPSMVKCIYDEMAMPSPQNPFTIGINDDMTHLSLKVRDHILIDHPGDKACIFYGIGADGTVGATKIASQIICDNADMYAQAYFQFSAKKSGGYTVSQLRFSPNPIHAEYGIEQADYVGCNRDTYVNRFELVEQLRSGGTFTLNCDWTDEQLNTKLPARLRRAIAQKGIKLYTINAKDIALEEGLGQRINMIMLAAFFKLSDIIPYSEALPALNHWVTTTYIHEGGQVVKENIAAIARAADAVHQVQYPASWAQAEDNTAAAPRPRYTPGVMLDTEAFVRLIAQPCDRREGNSLPVSVFTPDGFLPMGTTAYEKRCIALKIPHWDVDKCVECTECSFVCPHAAIRPYLLDAEEKAAAPAAFITKEAWGKTLHGLQYRIQVYPEDCVGCGSCATICPGRALSMVPAQQDMDEQKAMLAYAQQHVTIKDQLVPRDTVNGSQFHEPMLEFSGACGGCGETPYVKLLTQLMGERMIVANATGCSSIWGCDYPASSWCVNRHGYGPAWGNSLFEDNAEYGYGIAVAIAHRRGRLIELVNAAVNDAKTHPDVKIALDAWLKAKDAPLQSKVTGDAALEALKAHPDTVGAAEMQACYDLWGKKSIWCIGGDGWAYDIGFAGLDHVLAQEVDINVLVMDTECYSNTGGQTSKATPLGSTAKYSYAGKRTYKKDLGRMMMTYANVYVASIGLGADYGQAIKAFVEADAHPGPSLVIAYCPCIAHGIRRGMGTTIVEEKHAVQTGYWPLYRYNPKACPPLTVDYQKPDGELIPFINGEDRYADLKMIDPGAAATLQPNLKEHDDKLFDILAFTAGYNPCTYTAPASASAPEPKYSAFVPDDDEIPTITPKAPSAPAKDAVTGQAPPPTRQGDNLDAEPHI